ILRPASDSEPSEVDLVTDKPPTIVIAVANEKNMKSLAVRLRRLLDNLEEPSQEPERAGSLVARTLRIVRDPRAPITKTAKKCREYLSELEACGARQMRPSVEALAALEALRTLLSDARAGDLALQGDPIGEADVRSWPIAHLDPALTELFETLMEGDE